MTSQVDLRFYALHVHLEAVVVRRSPLAFPSLAVMDTVLEGVAGGLDPWRGSRALLVDVRHVEGRNDSAFERVLQRHAPRLYAGFAPAVVLVQSLGGKLQVQRHARRDNTRTVATDDPDFAAEVLGVSVERLHALLGDRAPAPLQGWPPGAKRSQRRAS